MPAFHYIAVSNTGREQKGVIDAESEKHARQLLRERALVPISVRPARQKAAAGTSTLQMMFSHQKKLSSKELALFTRQFATLLAAGLPVEESLLAVSEQSEKPHVKAIILSVRGKVLEGHPLATALQEHPEAFTSLFCATIAAGEKTGHLDKVLLRLADYTEQQYNMRTKLRTALIYPSMIVLVAFAIVGFLLEYVVPKMIAVYSHLNQALPGLTQVLIGISDFVRSYGLYLLLIIVVAVVIFMRTMKKNEAFRERVHVFLLKLPLIGNAIKISNTARFARTLSILSAAGVSVLEAMTISAQLITSIPIKKSVQEAVHRVREGGAIHLALKQTGYFSPMSVHMIASGEASGQLESMLERVAIDQEGEIIRLIDVSLALFEPAVILLMGVIVLFIVLAVLLPIFQLNEFTG